jgi:perosamine synthetase
MFRTLSPTGSPIGFMNLFHGIKAELSKKNSISIFNEQMKEYLGSKSVFLLSSGKACLRLVLDALAKISDRNEVIIPAYSSFCLASAVAESGVVVKLCDIDPEYLDFDLEHLTKLVNEKTLAVIPVHLFGLVARLEEISRITHSKGAYLIEDAAQALGAEYNGIKVGTIGDVGIFSFGRGKSLSTIEGGIITTKISKLDELLQDNLRKLSYPKIGKLLVYGCAISFLLNPVLYSIPSSLPFLNIGANIYDPEIEINLFSKIQAGIGNSLFSNLATYNNLRRNTADILSSNIGNLKKVRLPLVEAKSKPSYIRFPVISMDQDVREKMFNGLNRSKLGVSKNFPFPLNEIERFKKYCLNHNEKFQNSKKISQTLFTVPTHPFVNRSDLIKIINKISYYDKAYHR